MADTKISALSAVTNVLSTDEFVLARSGTTKKIDAVDLAAGLTSGGGLFDAYVLIRDSKSSGTNGGSASTGAWTKHDLTTEVTDDDGLASLSSSVIVLTAGTYYGRCSASGLATKQFKIRLRNTTDSTTALIGTTVYAPSGNSDPGEQTSVASGVFTVGSSKNLELQYWANQNAGGAASVLGVASSTGELEVYAVAEFWRMP